MTPLVEGPSIHWLAPEAIARIAAEIEEARGVEIFFVGRRAADGLVAEVESHAYGTEGAVPVVLKLAKPGEVIIHNHPSGDLTPSEADLQVSSVVGNLGAGSYIVSNDGRRLRVVVRPHDAKKKTPVDPERVATMLGPGSKLAEELGAFEDRPQQRRMARAVVDALNNDGIAVVEAGTGTGKSLAYLMPSVLYALENEERVIVSTNTINLQEQILHKDLPMVRRALARDFTAELVKGRSNYVCKRKAQAARDELLGPVQSLIEDEMVAELRETLAWAAASESGDRSELPVPPRDDVWERVVSEADNCLRVRCSYYEQCFFYNSRRRAARANVIVANHALLLSDLKVRRESNNWSAAAVLPPAPHVVLDEAHHLEETATEHMGSETTRLGLRRLFGKLYRTDGRGRRGVLARASDKLDEFLRKGLVDDTCVGWRLLSTEVLPNVGSARDAADAMMEDFAYAFLDLARLDPPKPGIEHRVRLTPALTLHERWFDECEGRVALLAKEIGVFADANRAAIKGLSELPEDAMKEFTNVGMEWRALLERLEAQRRHALAMLKDDAETCRWVEISADRRGQMAVRLCTAPVSVAAVLRETLHSRVKSEVLTSATLTVDGDFSFLCERTGLAPMAAKPSQAPSPEAAPDAANPDADDDAAAENVPVAKPIETVKLETPFDYERQVFFGIPSDLGDPRSAGFDDRLATLAVRAIRHSGGRAFVLFTSAAQMRRLHAICAPEIRDLGISVLLQGEETRDRLLRRFREDETSVLFATSSFWEGVDVRGRALELLVIAKLPFAVPNEPVAEAQQEYLRARGLDPFDRLTVPRAIVRFKQGFGRLIRSRTDRGAVLIADDRVVRMAYGRRFLASLPPMDVRHETTDKLMQGLAEFLR